jgi:hypothetical protein
VQQWESQATTQEVLIGVLNILSLQEATCLDSSILFLARSSLTTHAVFQGYRRRTR